MRYCGPSLVLAHILAWQVDAARLDGRVGLILSLGQCFANLQMPGAQSDAAQRSRELLHSPERILRISASVLIPATMLHDKWDAHLALDPAKVNSHARGLPLFAFGHGSIGCAAAVVMQSKSCDLWVVPLLAAERHSRQHWCL